MNILSIEITSQEELDATINIFGLEKVIDGFYCYSAIFNKYIEEVATSIIKKTPEKEDGHTEYYQAIKGSICSFSSEHLLSFIKCSKYSPIIIRHVAVHLFKRNIKASGEIFDLIQNLDPKYLFDFVDPGIVEFHLNYYFVCLYKGITDQYVVKYPYIIEGLYRQNFHNYIMNAAEAFSVKDKQAFPGKLFFLTKELFDGFMEFISEEAVAEKKFFDELLDIFDCFKTYVDSNGTRWYLNYSKEITNSIQMEFHSKNSQSYYKTIYCFDPFMDNKTPKEIFDTVFNEFVESLK